MLPQASAGCYPVNMGSCVPQGIKVVKVVKGCKGFILWKKTQGAIGFEIWKKLKNYKQKRSTELNLDVQ